MFCLLASLVRCQGQHPRQPVQDHHPVGHTLFHPGSEPPGEDGLDRRHPGAHVAQRAALLRKSGVTQYPARCRHVAHVKSWIGILQKVHHCFQNTFFFVCMLLHVLDIYLFFLFDKAKSKYGNIGKS